MHKILIFEEEDMGGNPGSTVTLESFEEHEEEIEAAEVVIYLGDSMRILKDKNDNYRKTIRDLIT